jgi:hypothetical protein
MARNEFEKGISFRRVIDIPAEQPPHVCTNPSTYSFGVGSVIQCVCGKYYKLDYYLDTVKKQWYWIENYVENDGTSTDLR